MCLDIWRSVLTGLVSAKLGVVDHDYEVADEVALRAAAPLLPARFALPPTRPRLPRQPLRGFLAMTKGVDCRVAFLRSVAHNSGVGVDFRAAPLQRSSR